MRVSPGGSDVGRQRIGFHSRMGDLCVDSAFSPLTLVVVLMLVAGVPQQASGPPPMQNGQAPNPAPSATPRPAPEPVQIPLDLFKVPDGFEVTLWAATPLLHNPTNIDIDRDGRIWVAEGVRYRSHFARQPEGDRIVVLQDTDGDGKADSTHTFVQEPAWSRRSASRSSTTRSSSRSRPTSSFIPTSIATCKFDPAVDKREVLLTGFQGINHDHSLHSVTVGPDGKWIFNSGNTGGDVHRSIGEDVPHLRLVPSGPGRARSSSRTIRRIRRQAERRRACLRRRIHRADES